jgi:hypothetical protein
LVLATASVCPSAGAAILVPAPGTGHGVLTDAPPAEAAGSLKYSPGLGGTCVDPQPPETFYTWGYGFGRESRLAVGSPMFVCIGRFTSPEVNVSVTPPEGRSLVLPTLSFVGNEPTIVLSVSVMPRPPATRYRITRRNEVLASGLLDGDGIGTYQLEASGGGMPKTTSFMLDPPPSPRLLSPNGNYEDVAQGGRVSFGVAGVERFKLIQVSVFGPEKAGSRNQLRTKIVGRANKRGEVVLTLDIQSSESGLFCALLEPYAHDLRGNGFDPRVDCFYVNEQADTPATTR